MWAFLVVLNYNCICDVTPLQLHSQAHAHTHNNNSIYVYKHIHTKLGYMLIIYFIIKFLYVAFVKKGIKHQKSNLL